jgi:hypothetical protein
MVWRGKTGKRTAAQLLGVVWRGEAPPSAPQAPHHHKPSEFPALNAPERAVVVLCPDKIDSIGDAFIQLTNTTKNGII